jgi:uncharacterized membrane protein YfcA
MLDGLFDIYLPIAEMRVDGLMIIALGLLIGLIVGFFGLGGGLIAVPLLMFIGIEPHVAVACATNQMTASSFSSYLAYARRDRVDYKMSFLLLLGGLLGTSAGSILFKYLSRKGYIDTVISLGFVLLLAFIGFTTAKDAAILAYKRWKGDTVKHSGFFRKLFKRVKLPLRTTYVSSHKEISYISPALVGIFGGVMVSLLGIGGSLIMIPFMIYILRVKESYTAGTSQFQIIFTSIIATFMHALGPFSIDLVLSFILILGTAFGAQIGVRLSSGMDPINFRIALAVLIMLLCARVIYSVTQIPVELYDLEFIR